jgi:hypothetical protein
MSLRALCAENFRLKALSLLFAAVLGIFVALETKDAVEIPLQVKLINIPPGLALKEQTVQTPSVRVAGARILLIKQQLTGVAVVLDLAGAVAGKTAYSSLDGYVRLTDGLTLLRVSPAVVELVPARVGTAAQTN